MNRPFRIRIVQPCVGRRVGMSGYFRAWSMEPLAVWSLAAALPPDAEVLFHDDRLEEVPTDAPTDLALIPVETYTARRAYQIASGFRRCRVPVAMGGFHATACPEEVARQAESVVIGEAEDLLPRLVDDWRHGRGEKFYRASGRPALRRAPPDRRLAGNRRYLPLSLVETSRGCRHACEFCAITATFGGTLTQRPIDAVVAEVAALPRRRPVFFIDDNLTADHTRVRDLAAALTPLGIRWIGQAGIDAAWDEDLLEALRRSGCRGLLIGFESLAADDLQRMGKPQTLAHGGPAEAMRRLHRAGIAVYGTFVVGYDGDTPARVVEREAFARDSGMFIVAFNHLTPFPGTPLYARLAAEGRLSSPAWWLDPAYGYNQVPFRPRGMTAEELRNACLAARRQFFSWPGILRRARHQDWRHPGMLAQFFAINLLHQREIEARDGLPLGDAACTAPLIEA